MKRFFGKKNNNNIIISGDELFHLKKVLRMKEGDKIIACIDDDYDYYCNIKEIGKNDCICEIEKKELNLANPQKDITLFQMLPKKEYIDNIIPKSIELGVNNIYFFTSKWTMNKSLKEDRLNQQILTACKQCERSKLLKANKLLKFTEMLEYLNGYDLVLFPYEHETIDNTFQPKILNNKNKIAIIIGNEAGFTDEEANIIKNQNAKSISLGKRILRCDTAVVAVLSLVSILSNN